MPVKTFCHQSTKAQNLNKDFVTGWCFGALVAIEFTFKKLLQRILIVAILLLTSLPLLKAQFNIFEHEQRYQSRPFHFGISMAINVSNYKILLDTNYHNQNQVLTVTALNNPGFSLGILSDLHLSKSFELRFIPDLAFVDRSIQYTMTTTDTLPIKKIESVYLDFPLLLKYRSRPYKDMRMYVVGGIRYSIDMQSNATARLAEDLIKVYRNDFSLEYGIGAEFHLPLVTISPEIKASYGLINVLKPDDNLIFSKVIDRLRTRSLMLIVHFEG